MKTLLEILTLCTNYLSQKGISHPRRQAEELVANALNINRLQIYMEYDRPLTEGELDRCRHFLMRRAKGEPLSYIIGEQEFYGCFLKLTPDVLIPRQETEILVDKIAKQLEKENLIGKTLWDLCCGSGCIGIALKKRFPELSITLSDISPKALQIAQENAQRNHVKVQFLEGDLLTPFDTERTDYLVCNPPYVTEAEFTTLEKEVREYEPSLALISGPTGLEFYRRLSQELQNSLNPHAKVWFEMGSNQGVAIQQLFAKPYWKKCDFECDWAGHHRFFFLEIE